MRRALGNVCTPLDPIMKAGLTLTFQGKNENILFVSLLLVTKSATQHKEAHQGFQVGSDMVGNSTSGLWVPCPHALPSYQEAGCK